MMSAPYVNASAVAAMSASRKTTASAPRLSIFLFSYPPTTICTIAGVGLLPLVRRKVHPDLAVVFISNLARLVLLHEADCVRLRHEIGA